MCCEKCSHASGVFLGEQGGKKDGVKAKTEPGLLLDEVQKLDSGSIRKLIATQSVLVSCDRVSLSNRRESRYCIAYRLEEANRSFSEDDLPPLPYLWCGF